MGAVVGINVVATHTSGAGLDLPFPLYFVRLFKRTILRILGLEPTPQIGCRETWQQTFLASDSILVWAVGHHRVVKARYTERMRNDELAGRGARWKRFTGWRASGQLRQWLSEVRLWHQAR